MALVPEEVAEEWADYGEREFISWLERLEPELSPLIEEYVSSPRRRGQGEGTGAINYLRWAADQAARHRNEVWESMDLPNELFEEYDVVLEQTHQRDPDALYVAWALAELASARAGEKHDALVASATNSLGLLIGYDDVDRLPAFYYLLMVFNQPAARYLGRLPNAAEFVEAWMEQPIPDPEFSYMELEDPNYFDYAIALDRALRPNSVIDRSVFTTTAADPSSRFRILGDMIEEGDMEAAIKFLKTKPTELARERKHGLEGA